MASPTLTSMALLKVNIDSGKDYLDYLRPFVLQILVDFKPDPISVGFLHEQLIDCYGLNIPDYVIQVVFKRIVKSEKIVLRGGVYRITGEIKDPGITKKRIAISTKIDEFINGLYEFGKSEMNPFKSNQAAESAVFAFLERFNIECLQSYLEESLYPQVVDSSQQNIYIVSKYLMNLYNEDRNKLADFVMIVQGQMLANAILCPDLQNAPKKFRNVTFYLDTPLIIRALGLAGESKKSSITQLIEMLTDLGASVRIFSHTRKEVSGALLGAAEHLGRQNAYGEIVAEAQKAGRTKSDLVLMEGNLDEVLSSLMLDVVNTPEYIEKVQIDEQAFEEALKEEVKYYNNPKAMDYDINSVRSIFVLRGKSIPTNIENSIAMFVTSNSAFANVAFQYGLHHDKGNNISSVITDFSLANIAWLKSPMRASSIPMIETISVAYAALQPSQKLLQRYMNEVQKLVNQGKITPTNHQILRSSIAHSELMNLTQGVESEFSDETAIETLERVTELIKREENIKLINEQEAHEITKSQLVETQQQALTEKASREKLIKNIISTCKDKAKRDANIIVRCIKILISIVILLVTFNLDFGLAWLKWSLVGLSASIAISSYWTKFSIKALNGFLEKRLYDKGLRKQIVNLGIDDMDVNAIMQHSVRYKMPIADESNHVNSTLK